MGRENSYYRWIPVFTGMTGFIESTVILLIRYRVLFLLKENIE